MATSARRLQEHELTDQQNDCACPVNPRAGPSIAAESPQVEEPPRRISRVKEDYPRATRPPEADLDTGRDIAPHIDGVDDAPVDEILPAHAIGTDALSLRAVCPIPDPDVWRQLVKSLPKARARDRAQLIGLAAPPLRLR